MCGTTIALEARTSRSLVLSNLFQFLAFTEAQRIAVWVSRKNFAAQRELQGEPNYSSVLAYISTHLFIFFSIEMLTISFIASCWSKTVAFKWLRPLHNYSDHNIIGRTVHVEATCYSMYSIRAVNSLSKTCCVARKFLRGSAAQRRFFAPCLALVRVF